MSDEGPVLLVAMTTQDLKSVNAHFGSAKKLVVYEVSPKTSQFLKEISFDDTTGESGDHDAGADKLGAKVNAIAGCHLLFTLAIGASAAQKVVNAKIKPIKLSEVEPIDQVVSKVQAFMVGDPPPWLRPLLQTKKKELSFLDEED